ncbi:hypothetical protein HIM_01623 [Hirsutella minnesotensis 3608]|nr:hypothetical protein HIM_01623 [Hirsutella minnesotensis 3608]
MAKTRNAGRPFASQDLRHRNPSSSRRVTSRPCYHEPSDSDEGDFSSMDSHPQDSSEDGQTCAGGANSTPRTAKRRRSPRTKASGANENTSKSSNRIVPQWPAPSSPGGGGSRSSTAVPPKKRQRLSTAQDEEEASTEFIPNWQDPRIPFQCWADILFFAASIGGSTEELNTSWLVQAATICRTFAEPALTSLYRCPQLRHSTKVKRLAILFNRPPTETFCNYRIKVEALHMDIHIIPPAIIHQMIRPLQRLKELIIYTPMDQPPYRQLDVNLRWHYSEDLFRALGSSEDNNLDSEERPPAKVLKSWEWSGRFFGGCIPDAASMTRIHQTPTFAHLTKLSITNFQVPSLSNLHVKAKSDEEEMRAFNEDGMVIEAMAHAISQLTRLNHLVFESSTVMNDRLLPLLPKKLAHLELINCWEIKSADLAEFLLTHGSKLRTLSLRHNQSLALDFLVSLCETCPELRELHLNLSYYRHHDSVDDADPLYDQALLPGQIPRWPSSLRVINIEHVRDWSVEAAEGCLQSLIDSAKDLPHLRHLVIKSTLDIPWQVRATMRKEWRATLEKVFLRPSREPMSNRTLRPSTSDDQQKTRTKRRRGPPSPPSRRSGRIAAHSQDEDDGQRGRAGKSLRRKPRKLSYRDPDTDEDEVDQSDSEADTENGAPARSPSADSRGLFVQGLCKTVNVQFDNQKVRELQYGMEDFLDEEDDESEDEWDGDYDDDDDVIVFR